MKTLFLAALAVVMVSAAPASAEVKSGSHRFSLSGNLIILNNPDRTGFAVGAEYEYRTSSLIGFGAQAAHVFSDSSLTMLSAPTLFLHPLLGDWYVSAAPILYFGSDMDTAVGARFTTRMPLDIDILMLTPTFGVDIIEGGPNYIFGLAIGI